MQKPGRAGLLEFKQWKHSATEPVAAARAGGFNGALDDPRHHCRGDNHHAIEQFNSSFHHHANPPLALGTERLAQSQ